MKVPPKVRRALVPVLDEIAAELEEFTHQVQKNRLVVGEYVGRVRFTIKPELEHVMSELARLARALYTARKHLHEAYEAERLKVRENTARAAQARMARTIAKRRKP